MKYQYLLFLLGLAAAQNSNTNNQVFGEGDKDISSITNTTRPLGSGSNSRGYFVFVNPKKVQFATEIPLVRAGDFYRIQWDITPKGMAGPANVTIQWRRGVWPDVSQFFTLYDGVNNGYLDWKIPENFLVNQYIFKIQTNQTDPPYTVQVSYPIKVYQSQPDIVLPDSASLTSVSMLTIFSLILMLL